MKGLPPKNLRDAFGFSGERSVRESAKTESAPRYEYQSSNERPSYNTGYRQEQPSEPVQERRPMYDFEDEGEIHIPSFLRKKS